MIDLLLTGVLAISVAMVTLVALGRPTPGRERVLNALAVLLWAFSSALLAVLVAAWWLPT